MLSLEVWPGQVGLQQEEEQDVEQVEEQVVQEQVLEPA